ncbi:VanZ family protein [Pseudotamlana carrageenivorans]|uniref:Uncharacterized protein n=1 Tax=Pseudotamlana carrageenivorans TaxID=2069432 RepID=A0A2I7SKH4_9FLAO|nr:VanZ family protein [Tamlana carrageenivorans]AUS06418.1 hypothetical protein C1A40_13620 [Tamlana carrageenivorans]
MNKTERIIYAIIFYSIGFFLNSIYRPYVYSNEINDFGIADMGNNIVFVPGVYFLLSLISKKPIKGIYKDIFIHTSFLIFFEVLSLFINGIGTFDFKDIFALLIGAGITYLIVRLRTNDLTELKDDFLEIE